jgi:hypothetical protein
MQAFVRVVNTSTEEDYNFRRRELHFVSPVEASYVDRVWLDIWSRRIVAGANDFPTRPTFLKVVVAKFEEGGRREKA